MPSPQMARYYAPNGVNGQAFVSVVALVRNGGLDARSISAVCDRVVAYDFKVANLYGRTHPPCQIQRQIMFAPLRK